MNADRHQGAKLVAMLVGLWVLAMVLLYAATAGAQVRIDDRDVMLDDGGTLEQMLAGRVVPNPSSPGTWSAGWQEAVDRCALLPGSACEIVLPCGQDYDVAARASWPTASAIKIYGVSGLTIRGCGPSSELRYNANSGDASFNLIEIGDGAGGTTPTTQIVLKDFTIRWTELCASACNAGTGSPGHSGQIVEIIGPVSDLTMQRVNVLATSPVTSDLTFTSIRNVSIDVQSGFVPASFPTRIAVLDGHFQVTTRGGIIDTGCRDCVFSRNVIDYAGRPNDSSNTPPLASCIATHDGQGLVIADNVCNFTTNGHTNTGSMTGLYLSGSPSQPGGAFDVESARYTAVATGNSFVGLRRYNQFAVDVNGFHGLAFTGNTIQGGRCAASVTTSCRSSDDCEAVGGLCEFANFTAIYQQGQVTDNQAFNRGNLYSGNTIRGIIDDEINCAYQIFAIGGTDPLEDSDNVFAYNVLWLDNAADDGLCGDATRLARNEIHSNHVVGATTRCIEGQDTTGCGLLFTPASKLVTPARLSLPQGTAFPSSPAPASGECFYLTTAASVGACTAGAGSAKSLCCYNGSAWAAP